MSASKTWVSVCVVIGLLAGTAGAVVIDTVQVGDAGNAADGYYGAVAYTYQIGKYEVTSGQYTEFLNAVAKTDTYGLYNVYMDYDAYPSWYGCNIKRTGSPGSYTYSVASDWAKRPVNWVSWGDAARFANWMRNGQPSGAQNASTTEDGSYSLNGATSDAALLAATRKANASWVISSEDEWYKAAYYKGGATNAGYWKYPTSSDSINTSMANYAWSVGHTTDAGFYLYSSPYGTFDQGGNVWEWNEARIGGSYRGYRGGAFDHDGGSAYYLRAAYRDGYYPTGAGNDLGFRVAYVPEPATILMLALAGVGIVRRRK